MPDLSLVNMPGTGPLIYGDQGSGTRAATDFLNFQKNNTETFSVDYLGLPDPGGNQATRYIQRTVGDIAADSDLLKWFLFEVRATITIIAAYYSVDTDTADGSAVGQSLAIVDESANAVCTASTNAGNPGATQAVWVTLGAITNGTLTAGDYLKFTPTHSGAGLAMSGLAFYFTYTLGT